MITEDLVIYIQAQIKKNVPEDVILSRLILAGWHEDDAKAGLAKVKESTPVQKSIPVVEVSKPVSKIEEQKPSTNILDPYRELPETDSVQDVINQISKDALVAKREEQKLWEPKISPNQVTTQALPQMAKEDLKVEKPIIPDLSHAQEVINNSSYREKVVKVETPKTTVEVMPLELTGEKIASNVPIEPISNINNQTPKPFVYVVPEEDVGRDVRTQTSTINTPLSNPVTSTGNTIPVNIVNTPVSPRVTSTEVKPVLPVAPVSSSVVRPAVPSFSASNIRQSNTQNQTVSQRAMLSSFVQDISSNQQSQSVLPRATKNGLSKVFIIALFFILVGGGVVYAFMGGYINIKNIKLPSFVKKDPKVFIVGMPTALHKAQSYKVDTNINVSLPSFSNITSALSSGEEISSTDKDSLTLSVNGLVTHGPLHPLYDYSATLKSSIFTQEISTNLKYDGNHYFVNVPDLSSILPSSTPAQSVVSMTSRQADLILPELSQYWRDKIGNSNIYKVVSNGIPEYAMNTIASSFQEFVTHADVTEKNTEDIRGVSSYHYLINADKQSTKKFLTSIGSIFMSGIPEDSKKSIDEALGAVNIDSLEIWIGKEDNRVHQLKVSLTIPLSKVIGFGDKGIGDNSVRFDLQTSFYDFNIPNVISIPDNAITIQNFVKIVHDIKIKNKVSLFAESAQALKNAEGSFGKKSNPSGSCMSPVVGSLFSPLGHGKGASTAVGGMAGVMTDTLNLTNNMGSCYSTTKAWAAAFPLSVDNATSICIDSKGTFKTVATLSGTACE